jgi:hypothetical protein
VRLKLAASIKVIVLQVFFASSALRAILLHYRESTNLQLPKV